MGSLYGHAGYLEDAERAFARVRSFTAGPPYDLWRAWVVYGRLDRAENSIDTITGPENKARFLLSLADLIWRTGQSDQARLKFVQAKVLAAHVADLSHRKQLLSAIDQGLQFVSGPPPDVVTSTPHPRPQFNVQSSPIPLFPITADGFKDTDPTTSTAQANVNADFLENIYDRVAARDPDGLQRLAESASTPFQKALGLASLEHLMILSGKFSLAEEFATAIPETDSSSLLAKAEALSAVGAARLRAHSGDTALMDFTAAIRLVLSVGDLPLGQVSVLISIATAQFKGGLIEDANVTFRVAILLAQNFPQRPKQQPGLPKQTVLAIHYRDEAYKRILTSAIAQRDMPVVNDVIGAWNKTSDDADGAAVEAWLDADRPDEAIAMARKIENSQARVRALLQIARTLSDRAGVPIF